MQFHLRKGVTTCHAIPRGSYRDATVAGPRAAGQGHVPREAHECESARETERGKPLFEIRRRGSGGAPLPTRRTAPEGGAGGALTWGKVRFGVLLWCGISQLQSSADARPDPTRPARQRGAREDTGHAPSRGPWQRGMGFLDLSAAARETYFHQNEDCLIPGYTGHCPMLKFRFGKPYGANTRDILKELRERASPGSRGAHHRYGEPHYLNEFPLRRVHSEEPQPPWQGREQQRARPFVLGYTGFVPGMTFRFGTSFGRAADAALALLEARSVQQAGRRAREARDVQANPPPPQLSIRGRDVMPEAIAQPDALLAEDRYNDSHISVALPPIAGYTGHIPGLKGTEASLSQRYHTAVTRGLRLLEQEMHSVHSQRGPGSGAASSPASRARIPPSNAAQP
ncbi:Protein FAM166B [Frankliniella fusca]|uniref:Protein FAM166B n=1 Tax=Frankliniella fusca TaxID=407009 RepID=A0AAE1GZD1_9NEOP|nr:Protein FAM166B [Frankliniella fusca]